VAALNLSHTHFVTAYNGVMSLVVMVVCSCHNAMVTWYA